MSNTSFKSIFVLTLVTSSLFFYVLLSAFNLVQFRSLAEPPPLPTNRLQYVSSKESKDLTIRNVGFCILGSVGAGLVIAEISRKLHFRRKTAQVRKQQIQAAVFQIPDHPDDLTSPSKVFPNELESDHVSFHLSETEAFSPILTSQFHPQGQTCRIRVPHLQQSLFAIQLDDQYYSFARAEKTREKALSTVARLFDRGDRAIITHTSNRYTVWIWQPFAEFS